MANNRQSNIIYVDETGQLTTETNVKLIGVFFTPSVATDSITLKETSSDSNMLYLEGLTVESYFFDLADSPVIFKDGVYATISSGAKATLILRPVGRGN